MSQTANLARTTGVEMNQLIGIIATVAETTQNSASSVGNALKTVFSRMSSVKAGKSIDEAGESLNDVEKVLKGVNIDLRDGQGEWRDFYEVLNDVASIWKTLSSTQQSKITTALGGTRQRENILVALENWDKVRKYSDVALNSSGTATKKYQAYLEGLEAAQAKLQATFENFSQTLLDKGIIQGFYDLGAGALELATKLIALLPVIKMLGAALIGVGISKLVLQIPKLVTWVKSLGAGFNALRTFGLAATSAEKVMAGTTMKLADAEEIATAASSALSVAISLITAAISIGIMAINSYNQGLEEETRKHREAMEAARDQHKTLEGLREQYEKLNSEGGLTPENTEKLSSLQKDINSSIEDINKTLDTEYKAVDLINGAYDDQIAKIKQAENAIKDKTETELKAAVAAAKHQAEAWAPKSWSELWAQHTNKYVETATRLSVDSAVKYYKELIERRNKLINKEKTDTNTYRQLEKALTILEARYGNYMQLLEEVENATKSSTEENEENGNSLGYIEEQMDSLIDTTKLYQNTLKYATTLIDRQIEALQKEKEAIQEANEETQKQLDLYDKALAYVNRTVDAKIKALEEEKKQLSKKNDESERELKLQELKDNLEKAKRNKIRTYSEDRGWYWTDNAQAVAEAQKALDEEQAERDLESQTEAIDNAIEEWEKYKEALGTVTTEYEESVDYKAFLNNQSFITEKGINSKDLSEIERFKNSYIEKQNQIAQNTTETIDNRIKEYQKLKEEYEDIAKDFELSNLAQYAALTAGANYQEEVLSGRLARCKAFVASYNAEMAKLNTGGGYNYGGNDYGGDDDTPPPPPPKTTTTPPKTTTSKFQRTRTSDGIKSIPDGAFTKATTIPLKNSSYIEEGDYRFYQTRDGRYIRVKSNNKEISVKRTRGRKGGLVVPFLTGLSGTHYYYEKKKAATGTHSSSQGVYNLNELGDELIVPPSRGNYQLLQKGTGVLTHGLTERLMSLANNPYSYIHSAMSQMGISPNTSQNQTINISNITLPNVKNGNDFVKELQLISQNR